MNHNAAHTALINAILKALGCREDCVVWRQERGRYRTMDGMRVVDIGVDGYADICVALRGGGMIQGEAKTGKGKLNKLQKNWKARMEALGVPCFVWRSVGEAVADVDRATG